MNHRNPKVVWVWSAVAQRCTEEIKRFTEEAGKSPEVVWVGGWGVGFHLAVLGVLAPSR